MLKTSYVRGLTIWLRVLATFTVIMVPKGRNQTWTGKNCNEKYTERR